MDELLHLFSSWVKISMFMEKKKSFNAEGQNMWHLTVALKKEISMALLKFLIHLYSIFP